jgi:2-polyprenyl-3-methyl-5-hydroxy-6-metoxy-1,4-benzoquinol methylase
VDLEAETITGDGFDVVILADVLEYLKDPSRTLFGFQFVMSLEPLAG